MPRQIPTAAEMEQEYKAGVVQKGAKWLRNLERTTGIAEAAKSDAAEATYAAAMQAAISNKQRQKGLADVSDETIKAGARAVGAAGYSGPASAKSAKYARNVAPFRDALQNIVNSLPARTADPAQNVQGRVLPIATGLAARKRQG